MHQDTSAAAAAVAGDSADTTDARSPTVLLVPGLWHGGWVWSTVQALLDERGIPHRSITFPGVDRQDGDSTFAGHCAHLRTEMASVPGPLVIVAHSYGGAVVSQAADPSRVRALVFVSAFPLEPGESIADVVDSREAGDVAVAADEIHDENGLLAIDPSTALSGFYQDCDPTEARAMVDRLTPEHPSTRTARVTVAGWQVIPSLYVVCTQDRALTVERQRFLAARLDATRDIESGHSPMVSRPQELTEIIAGTVRTVPGGPAALG